MPKIGQSVSHYRIVAMLGQGGMGEVFHALDTNLDRSVALKFLPDVFSGDPERLARFEREAKLLASLNHPNIATVHGLDQAEGMRFLVMELVDGETLARRIAKGPLPVEEALDVCRQIAEGLEAAHEKGVIHRDLKPGNVMITPGDRVKILDFGLAKAFQGEASDVNQTHSPTITEAMTRAGMVLGTAAYMSPEQAKGKPVDKRADIWAFGCVLYECLTGKRAFEGENITETLASILKGEPDWQALPSATPGRLKELLRRCLQKDPKLRLHDIADARLEIGDSALVDTVPIEAPSIKRRHSLVLLIAAVAVALLAGVLSTLLFIKYFQYAASPAVLRTSIKVESGHWLDGGRSPYYLQRPSRTAAAISSDGGLIVYSAIQENPGPQARPQLYLRRMDQLEARPIAGTEGGISLFLSPDSRWLGFWADGKLKKIPVEGGVATALCNAVLPFGANWGDDDRIVFADGEAGGLSVISAEGGKPERLTEPDPKREESSHRLPSWLPNGKAVVFTVMKHGWDSRPSTALLRLDTLEWHVLLQDAADARYAPTGHLVFLRQGTLMAVRFDLGRLEVVGQPVALVENVMQAFATNSISNTGAGQFSVSDTGSLLYATGGVLPDQKDTLVWVDQSGKEEEVTDIRFPFFAPRLSPDGRRIAYGTAGWEWQIWVYEMSSGANSRLTGEGRASYPIWTPDGKRIVFSWQKSPASNLFWQPYDGSSSMERITSGEYSQFPGSWSADGTKLVLVEIHPDTGFDIGMMDAGSKRATPFLNAKFRESYPEFSPDGRWLAYSSDESGRPEVYVVDFPAKGVKRQISNGGGFDPLWARNGGQLFYRQQDQFWAVDVQTEGGFTAGKPRLLFDKPGYGYGSPARTYDLSLDGKRFLMVKLDQRKPTPVTELILVQNWFEELERLVPAGNR